MLTIKAPAVNGLIVCLFFFTIWMILIQFLALTSTSYFPVVTELASLFIDHLLLFSVCDRITSLGRMMHFIRHKQLKIPPRLKHESTLRHVMLIIKRRGFLKYS